MLVKLFIPKITFDSELGKKQRIQILLTEKNELPFVDSIQKEPDINIELGNEFYKDKDTQYRFANTAENIEKAWQKGGRHLALFSELTPENCIDYEAIKRAIIKLGYKI